MKPQPKLPPAARRERLLEAALVLAGRHGYENVTRNMIAAESGCSGALISWHWTANELQAAILTRAIEVEQLDVLAQGLALRHPIALAAPETLRLAAAETLV